MGGQLTPDCLPWLTVAGAVMAGFYDDIDATTRESLSIGMRGIEDETCQSALTRLWPKSVPDKHRRSWARKENDGEMRI